MDYAGESIQHPRPNLSPDDPPIAVLSPSSTSLTPTAYPSRDQSTAHLPTKPNILRRSTTSSSSSDPDFDISALRIRIAVLSPDATHIVFAAEQPDHDSSTTPTTTHGTTYHIFTISVLDPISRPRHRFQARLIRLADPDIESESHSTLAPTLQLASFSQATHLVVTVPSDAYTLSLADARTSPVWLVHPRSHRPTPFVPLRPRRPAKKYYIPHLTETHLYLVTFPTHPTHPTHPNWYSPHGKILHVFSRHSARLIRTQNIDIFTSSLPDCSTTVSWDPTDGSILIQTDVLTFIRDAETLCLRWYTSRLGSGRFCSKQGRWAITHRAKGTHDGLTGPPPLEEGEFVVSDIICGLDIVRAPTPFLPEWDEAVCRVHVTTSNVNTLAEIVFSRVRPDGACLTILSYDTQTSTWSTPGIDLPLWGIGEDGATFPPTLLTNPITGACLYIASDWTIQTALEGREPSVEKAPDEPEEDQHGQGQHGQGQHGQGQHGQGQHGQGQHGQGQHGQGQHGHPDHIFRPAILDDRDGISCYQFHGVIEDNARIEAASFVNHAIMEKDERFMTTIVPGLPKLLLNYPTLAIPLFTDTGYVASREDTRQLFLTRRARDPELRQGTGSVRAMRRYIMWDGDDLHAFADRRMPSGITGMIERLYGKVEFRSVRIRPGMSLPHMPLILIPTYTTRTHSSPPNQVRLCTVPLPGLCVYPRKPHFWRYLLDARYRARYRRSWDPWTTVEEEGRTLYPHSVFAALALDDRLNQHPIFDNPVMRPVIDFKWRHFARSRLILIWTVLLSYYTCFWLASSEDLLFIPARRVLYAAAAVLAALLAWAEIRQILGEGRRYWANVFNWFG
ncbi:hypothetical protein BC938DRAFT_475674 [Jimgerdemannia flammicorona]|uniref:Uncharacterized protein n=1 Tax=Jimgerdemannia flammicorona TaxID=994334 RepID=A0A433PQ71_9FUNG|nr:hypothetical protein BC938DRAFT_475674 [Jimgerdemannia flammicorona]